MDPNVIEAIKAVMAETSASPVHNQGNAYVVYLDASSGFESALKQKGLDPKEVLGGLKETLTEPLEVGGGVVQRAGRYKGGFHFVVLMGTA